MFMLIVPTATLGATVTRKSAKGSNEKSKTEFTTEVQVYQSLLREYLQVSCIYIYVRTRRKVKGHFI